jgi:hypothetical protein
VDNSRREAAMIVALLNQHSSVSKPRLASHFAGQGCRQEKRIVLIGTDPQGLTLGSSEPPAPLAIRSERRRSADARRDITIAAFQRSVLVPDPLRHLPARGFPRHRWRPFVRANPNAVSAIRLNAGPLETEVELTWLEGRIEHWIRFGRDCAETILDRRRRILRFAPGSVFAFVRWASNDFGTIVSRIDIARAINRGEPHQTLPFVHPGGEILLRINGWPKVERVLQAIDAVEALGVDPADAAPDHWRHLHNRLLAGVEPRPYSHEQHRAWLLRRRLVP